MSAQTLDHVNGVETIDATGLGPDVTILTPEQAQAEELEIREMTASLANFTAPPPEPVVSIFAERSKSFTRYAVEIKFLNKIMGGVPKSPDVIEAWLRTKLGVTDEQEIKRAYIRTLSEVMGVEPGTATEEDLLAASSHVANLKNTNGFKWDSQGGLFIEGRQVKAGLKENTNVAFAGERWGVTKKGPRNFLAERVWCPEDRIYLGVMTPTGVEQVIGHVTGPQGPRSTLGYHEYVMQPTIRFSLVSYRDQVTEAQWVEILSLLEWNGIGALRSQGHGRFATLLFDRQGK